MYENVPFQHQLSQYLLFYVQAGTSRVSAYWLCRISAGLISQILVFHCQPLKLIPGTPWIHLKLPDLLTTRSFHEFLLCSKKATVLGNALSQWQLGCCFSFEFPRDIRRPVAVSLKAANPERCIRVPFCSSEYEVDNKCCSFSSYEKLDLKRENQKS